MFSTCLRTACLITAGIFVLNAQDANRSVTRYELQDVIKRLDKMTGDFKETFNKAVEHSLIDETKLEDRAKHRADDLHESAEKLKEVYNDKKDKDHSDIRKQLDKTLSAGADVDRIVMDHRFTDRLQREWDQIRADLNLLASAYGLSPLSRVN